MYGCADRGAWIGNSFGAVTGPHYEHPLRLPHATKTLIKSNTFFSSHPGKEGVKLHAQKWNPQKKIKTNHVVLDSNSLIVNKNANWGFALLPQDSLHDERLEDIIVSRNLIYMDSNSCQPIRSSAKRLTVRNNIFVVLPGAENGWPICVAYGRWKKEPNAESLWAHRNTLHVKGDFETNPTIFVEASRDSSNLNVADNMLWSENKQNIIVPATNNCQTVNNVIPPPDASPFMNAGIFDYRTSVPYAGSDDVFCFTDYNCLEATMPWIGAIGMDIPVAPIPPEEDQ